MTNYSIAWSGVVLYRMMRYNISIYVVQHTYYIVTHMEPTTIVSYSTSHSIDDINMHNYVTTIMSTTHPKKCWRQYWYQH